MPSIESLVINQVQGEYLTRDHKMMAYLDEVKSISMKIKDFKIRQIPIEENRKADALANLAFAFDFIADINVPLEFLPCPSIEVTKLVCTVESSLMWIDNIISYLQDGTLPTDKLQDRCIQHRSAKFCLLNRILYKRIHAEGNS